MVNKQGILQKRTDRMVVFLRQFIQLEIIPHPVDLMEEAQIGYITAQALLISVRQLVPM
jgi:hypothetical protein